MWNDSYITTVGAALLSQWAAGGTLTITKVKTGTGNQTASQLKADKDLVSPVTTATVSGSKKVSNGRSISIRIGSHTTAYTCTQIGIFGKVGSGAETLIAIFQDSAGVPIPNVSDVPSYAYLFEGVIAVSNSGTLNVSVQEKTWMDAADYDPNGDGKVTYAETADKAKALDEGADKTELKRVGDAINSLNINEGKVAKAGEADTAGALAAGADKNELKRVGDAINSLNINEGKVAKAEEADTATALGEGDDRTALDNAKTMADHIHIGTEAQRAAYSPVEGDIWFVIEE